MGFELQGFGLRDLGLFVWNASNREDKSLSVGKVGANAAARGDNLWTIVQYVWLVTVGRCEYNTL